MTENKFTLYWLDGKREVVEGEDIADAMNIAGYGQGALRTLDFYSTGDDKDYVYDKINNSWTQK